MKDRCCNPIKTLTLTTEREEPQFVRGRTVLTWKDNMFSDTEEQT